MKHLSRRQFFLGLSVALPLLAALDARYIEPKRVRLRRIPLPGVTGKRIRFVHITDIHHKGDRAYLESIVSSINSLSPDFVCLTGDLIEEASMAPEALGILAGIKSPVYGVPGNHDYWSKAVFEPFERTFAATGGGWMQDGEAVTADRSFVLKGISSLSFRRGSLKPSASLPTIVLMHYPAWVKNLPAEKFALILAGHSHGGQVRIPFYGPIFVPFGVDQYDLGMYQTASGPLYVNSGLGWFPVPIRFNCRPEITVFET